MPHHIYHTHAIVIRGRNQGDADRVLELLTERFGLLTVSVRGLRKETSKLRYILQPHAWVEASVVRGGDGWRLTTANPIWDKEHRPSPLLARVFVIVKKFYPEQTLSNVVFRDLSALCHALEDRPEHKEDWEALFLGRLLLELGYWGDSEHLSLIEEPRYDRPFVGNERATVVKEINRILRTVQT